MGSQFSADMCFPKSGAVGGENKYKKAGKNTRLMQSETMDGNYSAPSSESAATAETTLETTAITTAISIMSKPPPNTTNIDNYLPEENLVPVRFSIACMRENLNWLKNFFGE